MIALCTGQPTFETDGDRIILSVPSGKDILQIAMTRYQARGLVERGRRRLDVLELLAQEKRGAQIVAIKREG